MTASRPNAASRARQLLRALGVDIEVGRSFEFRLVVFLYAIQTNQTWPGRESIMHTVNIGHRLSPETCTHRTYNQPNLAVLLVPTFQGRPDTA